jgi:host factor-I protein
LSDISRRIKGPLSTHLFTGICTYLFCTKRERTDREAAKTIGGVVAFVARRNVMTRVTLKLAVKPSVATTTPSTSVVTPEKAEADPSPGTTGQSPQNAFLNAIRKQRTPVRVYLVNGVALEGVVDSYDQFTLILKREGPSGHNLVFKHAISTIAPISSEPKRAFVTSSADPDS